MASPETGDQSSVVGTWTVVQPGIPQFIQDVADAINSFVNVLLAVLNVLLTVLNIIKALLVGFLDPLVALVEAIISEVEAILKDLRQLGVYISGDLKPEWPYDNWLGGFAGYQRRMITRLVDRTDPTRPDFSSRSACLAVFFYVSVDISQILLIIQFINFIKRLFGEEPEGRALPTAAGLEVTYGLDGAAPDAFGGIFAKLKAGGAGAVINQANVKWALAPPGGTGPVNWPLPAPKGFLLEVSTIKDGLYVAYETPAQNADSKGAVRVSGLMAGPDGKVFKLYGGSDQVDIGDLAGTAFSGDPADRSSRLYGFVDAGSNMPIPIDALKDGDKYLLQRTFYFPTYEEEGASARVNPGQGFNAILTAEDMPYHADFTVNGEGELELDSSSVTQAKTVYVRVTAVSEDIQSATEWKWTTSANEIHSQEPSTPRFRITGETANLTEQDRGPTSAPLEVTFPGTLTKDYLDTVTAALLVLVLSRSDLVVPEDLTVFQPGAAASATGLEDIAKYLVPQIVGNNAQKFFRKDMTPSDFRHNILRRCQLLANNMYARTGHMGDTIEGLVIEQGAELLSFKWSNVNSSYPPMTILESVSEEATRSYSYGVGINPINIGLSSTQTTLSRTRLGADYCSRSPGFKAKSTIIHTLFIMGGGSADYSPVVYYYTGPYAGGVAFCRNVFLEHDNGVLLTQAAAVLNIAAGPMMMAGQEGAWIAKRLLPQGIPPVEQFLDQIMAWMRAIQAGLQSIIDTIIAYIEFLEARILEIEALIRRINALIQALLAFQVPKAAALVVAANGTDGVLQALVTADNAPSDDSDAYGAGVVLMAGGLPTALLEILQLFFPTED